MWDFHIKIITRTRKNDVRTITKTTANPVGNNNSLLVAMYIFYLKKKMLKLLSILLQKFAN